MRAVGHIPHAICHADIALHLTRPPTALPDAGALQAPAALDSYFLPFEAKWVSRKARRR